jgi:hypothetical protein
MPTRLPNSSSPQTPPGQGSRVSAAARPAGLEPAKTSKTESEGAGSSGLGGFGVARGQIGDGSVVGGNPREAAARALADAVVQALRSGDLRAAKAASSGLDAFVRALAEPDGMPQEAPNEVSDLRAVRQAQRRERK